MNPGIKWQVIAGCRVSALPGALIFDLKFPEPGDHDIFPGLDCGFYKL